MKLPAASVFPKTYRVDFPKLSGGLNLRELDYRLGGDETPDMQNLWWQDGVLQCRDGQVWLLETGSGTGYAACDLPFCGHVFFHIGDALCCADPAADSFVLTTLTTGVPENAGTFFCWQDGLFYKNRGGFYRITPQESGDSFRCTDLSLDAYVPVTVLNASPKTGSGDLYQPENRLSGKKTVSYNADGSPLYRLPVQQVDGVETVTVDGKALTTGWTADLAAGTVTFTEAPTVSDPPVNNTVQITYRKDNEDAFRSVMDCTCAMAAGGDQNLCILLGGCPAQPNAVFWNANDALSMNPSYFPMTNWNLVGGAEDPVTGFGRQYSTVVVFKARSIGKLTYGVETVEERSTVSFLYEDINTRVGCDLPGSIRLVENNLVFANTYHGVHRLRSSSAAYENNVDCISRKINPDLLTRLRAAETVVSVDDDERYWLCMDGLCYLWDYTISSADEPSWFRFTDIPAAAFFRDGGKTLCHLDAAGRVTAFRRVFSDYGGPIRKRYRFPTQFFGSYERLKDVCSILITVRSDTDTDVQICYETDYETREDATPIRTYAWRLLPRNLAHRCLSTPRYAFVARRSPGCRHVRHFAMELYNDRPGEDLAIVSTQIFFRYQGKER